ESVNILKGPSAAVLYGSRASAGAIVITTKSGSGVAGKTEVTVSSSLNFQEVYGLAPLQNSYGQGTQNNYVPTATGSWGPRIGTPGFGTVMTTGGEEVPYQAYPDNVNDFYNRGSILHVSVSIASGDNDKNYTLSIGN